MRPNFGYAHDRPVPEPVEDPAEAEVVEPECEERFALPIPERNEDDELEVRALVPACGPAPIPDPGDILLALAPEWPRVVLAGGRAIDGEEAWREAVARADSYELLALWNALRGEA
jgi:hypothetical protein